MHGTFLVSARCPECGAPIRYPEGSFTFSCEFCSSALRIAERGRNLRYVIPARFSREEVTHLIHRPLLEKRGEFGRLLRLKNVEYRYKPFWYVKGMVFCTIARKENNEILAKLWSHTFQANENFFPSFHSLGVRSEVLTVLPLDSDAVAGSLVLPAHVSREEAWTRAYAAASANVNLATAPIHEFFPPDQDDPADTWEARHPAETILFKEISLIGAKMFLLYYPVIRVVAEGSVCDWTLFVEGVSGSILSGARGDAEYEDLTGENLETGSGGNLLLTHRCKNCGQDLKPGDFDIAYYCGNCFHLWLLGHDDYQPLAVHLIEPVRRTAATVFVPFWEFSLDVEDDESSAALKTVGDLARMMKMGRHMLRKEDPARPLTFLVPALVTRNVGAMLKLAARINMFQKDLPVSPSTEFPYDKILHASLGESEAEAMLKPLLFAVLGRTDRATLGFLGSAHIRVTERRLVWYPFEDRGDTLADHFHQYHFPKRSMDVRVY